MSIHVTCEGCGKILSVPDGSEGRAIQCARCGKRMRVPDQAPPASAEAAPPPAAPPTPPPAAPVAPPAPPAAAPASGGMPDKDAFFRALTDEAAREQRETAAAKASKAEAEAELNPAPEMTVRGRSSAVKELRIKTAGDKSGYAVAEGAVPPAAASPPSAAHDMRPHPLRKLIAIAIGLLLFIGILIGIIVGVSGSKPSANRNPAPSGPEIVAPAVMPAGMPALPPALKEAAQALAAGSLVEVEVVEAADATAAPMLLLAPTGDLMLDVMNVHIRDKDNAGASLQQMRSAMRSAVYESVAAKLREKGLTPVAAGRPAPRKPGTLRSRLKVFISTTPVWAGFNFQERPTKLVPMDQAPPPRPGNSPPARRRGSRTPAGPVSPPGSPDMRLVFLPPQPRQLWDTLLGKGLTLSATFSGESREEPAQWIAAATDDLRADQLPYGLRIAVVRVAWEVGGRTRDLTDRPAAAEATPSGNAAEAGMTPPLRRPEQVGEIQLTARMGANRTCFISGFCQYDDVNLRCDTAEAGELASGLLAAPDADWRILWDGKADRDEIAAACRNILRLGGGPAIAEVLAAKPDRLPEPSTEALASVLKEDRSSPEWARPFLAARGPCGDAALIGLARQAKEENRKDFLQCVAAPAGHSPESVQAACCALIDLGRPVPEVNALIDTHAVKSFSEVRSPRGALAFPPQTAQTVLDWLLRNGTHSQRIGAAAAVAEGNLQALQDPVRSFVSQSLGSDPETLYSLCRGLEKAQSPLAFEILKTVAHRQLMQADVGDRFLPPAAFSDAGAPLPEGRFSRTVAAMVCAGLARFDKFEAGEALAELIHSQGPATRCCAIETLNALDDVDVSTKIRARFEFLSKKARNAFETQEWELLDPVKNNKLYRYDVPMLQAKTDLDNGNNAEEVKKICDNIIKENPSPALVKQAQDMKQQAEKLLEINANTPH